jgi:2',3'-cyclic-nucleotide 2'-phosphodiesterase (5'-nucleotidase family)
VNSARRLSRRPRSALGCLLLLLIAIGLGWNAPGTPVAPAAAAPDSVKDGEESLNLILSAASFGEMLACGHCKSKAGGLARRATLIQACRDTADYVLVGDGGDFLRRGGPDPQVDRFLVDMLVRRLHYTVFGIGELELSRGEPYLRDLTHDHPEVDWVSANILDKKTGKPRFAPYVTRRAGRATIGFTSVLEPSLAPARLDSALVVAPAGPALQNAVDAMHADKVDLVVVFGHLRHMPLRELLESVTGVDIAVSSHANRIENFPSRIGEVTQVYYGGVDGRFQNWANIVITPKEVFTYGGRTFYLLDHVPEDSTVVRELTAFLGTDSPADDAEPERGEGEGGGSGIETGAGTER